MASGRLTFTPRLPNNFANPSRSSFASSITHSGLGPSRSFMCSHLQSAKPNECVDLSTVGIRA